MSANQSSSLQAWLLHSYNRSDDDTVLLDYRKEIKIRRADLWRVCEHDGWLNDIIINFQFMRHREQRKKEMRKIYGELIDANVAHFLAHGDVNDCKQVLEDLELDSSKLFCLPVNDEQDFSLHEGGCHWSLLVHTPAVTADIPARWSHIDSMNHRNILIGEKMANKIARAMLMNEGRSSLAETVEIDLFSLEDTPQQKNGHDCGVFVVELAKKIVDFGVEWEIDDDFDMHDVYARQWRKDAYQDLEFLIVDEGEQFMT